MLLLVSKPPNPLVVDPTRSRPQHVPVLLVLCALHNLALAEGVQSIGGDLQHPSAVHKAGVAAQTAV